MKRQLFTTVAGLALLGAGAALMHDATPTATARPVSSQAVYTLDKVHSGVFFKIRHMGVSNFVGRFNQVDGSFNLDWENPSASFMEMTVQADSVDSNNERRDGHIKSNDFFNAKQFPTITFEGTAFKKVDDDTMEIMGELTFLGVTKPVTVTTELIKVGDTAQGYKMGLDSTFTFKRTEFGNSTYVENGALGDEVTIMAFVAGVRGEE